MNLAKHRTSFFFLILLFLFCGTTVAVMFTKGYKIDLKKKQFVPNGILIADSNPIGALVYVNGKLEMATNNTVSLPPAEYEVEIKKEGFLPWKKSLLVEKELVVFAEAFLFPQVPDIKPITFGGAGNPKISPDNTRIAYLIPAPDTNAGLWIMDISDTFSFFSKSPKLIAKFSLNFDLQKANYDWSPDGRQIVLEFSPTIKYLLDPNTLNDLPQLKNEAVRFDKIIAGWQEEENIKLAAKMKRVPEQMQAIFKNSAGQIVFSPDGAKIMYTATASAEIPDKLIPPITSASTQKETRMLKPNKLYIYDIKEDRNFEISNYPASTAKRGEQIPIFNNVPPKRGLKSAKTTPTPSLYAIRYTLYAVPQWFPTSRHLIWTADDNKIIACEYDNTNLTTIYSGSFIKPYVFVTLNTNRLIILADIDFAIEKPTATPTPVKKVKTTPAPPKPKTNLFSVSFR